MAAIAGSCGRAPEPAGPETAEPVGREEYERLVAKAAGTRLAVPRLAELAADAETRIEARMDRVAAAIRPAADWRPVFQEIRRDHPATVDEVLAAYREEVSAAADFLAGRDWVTLPPSLPRIVDAESPIVRRSFSLALYMNGILGVVTAPAEEADPGYLANHCRVCIPPLAVHEAYPGHHVAFYHAAIERHGLALGDPVEIRGPPENYFFHEGWGLDGELMMLAGGYYRDPARELAAWRMVLLRAARARIDALLHAGELAPEEAIAIYRDDLLMASQAAATEVHRHLERPPAKATYFVGVLQIQALRRRARAADPRLALRSFHDRLLRRPRRVPDVARDEFGLELARLAPLELGGTARASAQVEADDRAFGPDRPEGVGVAEGDRPEVAGVPGAPAGAAVER